MCRSASELKSLGQLNLTKSTVKILSMLDLSLEKMVSLARWVYMHDDWGYVGFFLFDQVWDLLQGSTTLNNCLGINGDTPENREKMGNFFFSNHSEGERAVTEFCEAVKRESFTNNCLFRIFQSFPFRSVNVFSSEDKKIIGPYCDPYVLERFCSMEEGRYIHAQGLGPREINEILSILQRGLSPAQYQISRHDIMTVDDEYYVFDDDAEELTDDDYFHFLTREEVRLLGAARKNSRMFCDSEILRIIFPK